MRFAGVAMVRNEADIVEAFVRHNLAHLDRLAVIDHGSVDGTGAILDALVGEGLPLSVERNQDDAQRQSEVLTRLARAEFAAGADVVFPLDADEFLKVRDRALLERVFASLPAGLNAALHWQTYVLDAETTAEPNPLRRARRRLSTERQGLPKVVLTRTFVASTRAIVGPGNHTVLPEGPAQDLAKHSVRLARIAPDVAALAHLPVRSAAQLVGKVNVGWLAHRAARPANPDVAFHWRELFHEFRDRGEPSPARLAEIAANYGLPMAEWQSADRIAFVDDPLPVTFELRYASFARADAATLVKAFASRLETSG
jgi:hypothetical protein